MSSFWGIEVGSYNNYIFVGKYFFCGFILKLFIPHLIEVKELKRISFNFSLESFFCLACMSQILSVKTICLNLTSKTIRFVLLELRTGAQSAPEVFSSFSNLSAILEKISSYVAVILMQ